MHTNVPDSFWEGIKPGSFLLVPAPVVVLPSNARVCQDACYKNRFCYGGGTANSKIWLPGIYCTYYIFLSPGYYDSNLLACVFYKTTQENGVRIACLAFIHN